MKKSQLRKIIKEEISKVLKEDYTPEFINLSSPKAKILTDIYYIGDDAEEDFKSDRGSAVPAYEFEDYITLSDIENEGDGMLYIEKGEEGWYDEEEGTFESYNGNSTTRINKEYITLI